MEALDENLGQSLKIKKEPDFAKVNTLVQ